MPTLGTMVSRIKESLTRSGKGKLTGWDDLIYQVIHDAVLDLAAKYPKAAEWRDRETVVVTSGTSITLTKTWITIESVFNVTDDWPMLEFPEPNIEAVYGQDTSLRAPRYYSEKNATVLELDHEPSVSTTFEIKGWAIPDQKGTGDSASRADIGELWDSLIRYRALADLAIHRENGDLAVWYQQKADSVERVFAQRIRRRLSEQDGVIQTRTEHRLSNRLQRRNRSLWDD